MAVVTLLTDFGLTDSYVAQMKGSLVSVAPAIRWIDISHQIPPQDLCTGAFVLWSAVEAFPKGSVHLAVVDPGVGTGRKAVVVRSGRGDLFVGPDNGLLLPAVRRLGGPAHAVEIAEEAFTSPKPSRTFHGRDIFAPVAAHLWAGVPIENLGPAVKGLAEPFVWPEPRVTGQLVHGSIVHVDTYGNLISNIPAKLLPAHFQVRVKQLTISGPHPHYQAVPAGQWLALVGSSGLLELSVRDGNAAQRAASGPGDELVVRALAPST